MKKILLSVSVTAMLFASNQYQIGIGVGKHNVSNSSIDNYNFLNLRVGKYLPKNHILRFELEKSEKILNNKESLTRALINVEHYFSIDKEFVPYAYIGTGYQWVSGKYDNNIIADLGIGIKYLLNTNYQLFTELRGIRDFGNNDNHFGIVLGISYNFGGSKQVVKTIKYEPIINKSEKNIIKDSDHDGVEDRHDKCPNTPEGINVDKNGCPLDSDKDGVPNYLDKCPNTPSGVSVDVNGCPVDSDRDGVPDYKDKCPHTLFGVNVDKNGCPLDSDKDGVPNYLDKCPNTLKGVKVNSKGCAVSFNFNINFANNSAKIKSEYIKRIKEFAKFLKDNPEYKAEIQGYTDNKGSKKYNQELSTKRAKAVYNELIKLGISKNRLTYKGFGELHPIASNKTPEGKAKNRRVVAKIYK